MPQSNAARILDNATSIHDVHIPGRFCGPPGSGNGGWTAGLLGKHVGPEVEITLKRPVPIDQTIEVITDGCTRATLQRGDEVIAVARAAELDLDIPDAVSFARAAQARADFSGYRIHPFPNCFVCGTARPCGEGMCLFTGAIDTGIVASSWIPQSELADDSGHASPELICAALDCPGAWGLIDRYGITGPFVLGRITYRLDKPVHPGGRYVVQGWARGREGRKAFCGTAVYDAAGEVCAAAEATWIQLR